MRRYLARLFVVSFITWVIGMVIQNYEMAVGALVAQVIAVAGLIVVGPPRR